MSASCHPKFDRLADCHVQNRWRSCPGVDCIKNGLVRWIVVFEEWPIGDTEAITPERDLTDRDFLLLCNTRRVSQMLNLVSLNPLASPAASGGAFGSGMYDDSISSDPKVCPPPENTWEEEA